MVGGVRFEHTHRVIAGVVVLLTLLLAGFVFKESKSRTTRILMVMSILAVLAQAILGGLTVIYLLPTTLSVAHACLGQTFLVLAAAIMWRSSRSWQERAPVTSDRTRTFRGLSVALVVVVYLQLILGAAVRHTGGSAVLLHILGAGAVVLVALWVKIHAICFFREAPLVLKPAAWIVVLIAIQIFFGISALYHVVLYPHAAPAPVYEVILATTHQTLGALILVLSVILAMNARRFLKA